MNPETFGQAYTVHRPYLLILAKRLVGVQDAEDIVQECTHRLLSGHLAVIPDDVQESQRFFVKALFSVGLDHLRHQAVERSLFVPIERLEMEDGEEPPERPLPDPRPGPYRLVASTLFLQAFRGVKMTERVWLAVEGYYGRGESTVETARRMGVTVHNVKAALREARTILQDRLKGWKP